MKIVSLFDGMACGMLAMLGADANVGYCADERAAESWNRRIENENYNSTKTI